MFVTLLVYILGFGNVASQNYSTGLVSQECLECICQQETLCQPVNCRMDLGSLSCGPFQIKEAYWIDCGELGDGWKECAKDIACASQCVQNYMERYADYYGCPATCESYAREHNGGPQGCHANSTLQYWEKLQTSPGCSGVQ